MFCKHLYLILTGQEIISLSFEFEKIPLKNMIHDVWIEEG